MKGKIILGAIGIVAVAGAIGGAYAYSKIGAIFEEGGTFLTWVPGRAFYVVGVYPWDGEHLEHVAELAGSLEGIYDSFQDFDEIDELNDLYYGEE